MTSESDDIHLSVVLPTYARDTPDHLDLAIESVVEQTRPPQEVTIVRDGPIPPALESVIEKWSVADHAPITQVSLKENRGLGAALREGVKQCKHEYVARMDADDVSVPQRFERQTGFLAKNPDIDIVGGYIAEFVDDPSNTVSCREVPTEHETIDRMARFRSPFNHGSVIFRKSAAISVGNYRAVDRMEDWDLWARMLLDGALTANVPDVLVRVRAGDELFGRRGGWEYGREEIRQQVDFLRWGFVTPIQFLRNLVLRVPMRFLPRRIRGQLYRRYLRTAPPL